MFSLYIAIVSIFYFSEKKRVKNPPFTMKKFEGFIAKIQAVSAYFFAQIAGAVRSWRGSARSWDVDARAGGVPTCVVEWR